MHIVDAHTHALPHWFEPVELLLAQMDANEIDQAVLVQVRGQFDNGYLMDCVRAHPDRFAAVVLVDVASTAAPRALEDLAAQGAVGIRLAPTDRSAGEDPLAIWRKAAALGIPVDLLGGFADFAAPEFESLVHELPDLPVVIEHLGGIGWEESPTAATFEAITALARFPNCHMKLHGLGEICARPMPFPAPMRFPCVPPFMRMAIEAFGPTRVMWGSDFPPVAGREGYRNALRWTLEHLDFCAEEAKQDIFAGTAARVFGMD